MKDKIRGALLGTAIGDALGMPAEGKSPDTIQKLYGYIKKYENPKSENGQPFHKNLSSGMWTDDTQLMMAIGQSLVNKKTIDYDDIANNHKIAFNNRRGWGKATIYSVQRMSDGISWWNSCQEDAAGNGPVMKIAPIGVLFGLDYITKFEMINVVMNISRMTHGDSRATIGAIAQCHLISSAMKHGQTGLMIEMWHLHNIIKDLERSFGYSGLQFGTVFERAIVLADNDASDSEIRDEIGAGPFTLESFPFTCALLYKHMDNLEECMEYVVNQGGDADTTGAIAGTLLGATYGYSKFPFRWRMGLEGRKGLLLMADKIYNIFG